MWKDLFCKDVYFSFLSVSPPPPHTHDNRYKCCWELMSKLWQKKKNKLKRPFVVFTIFVQHCYNEEFPSQKQISSPHMLGASFVRFLFLCFLKSFTSSVIPVSVIMPLKLMVSQPWPACCVHGQFDVMKWILSTNPFYQSVFLWRLHFKCNLWDDLLKRRKAVFRTVWPVFPTMLVYDS